MATPINADGGTSTVEIFSDDLLGISFRIVTNNVPSPATAITFPVTVTNSVPTTILQVLFTEDITVTTSSSYFICGSAGIQFGSTSLNDDGSIPTITVASVTGYPGLVQNGTGIAASYNNISIYNLNVATTGGSTLSSGGGWIAQTNFGYFSNSTGILIVNCSSSGLISGTNQGGIVGAYAGSATSGFIIRGCSSSGNIGAGSGGIVANNAAKISIDQCFSKGTIGTDGGGILGASSGLGTTTITNCFSLGSIGSNAGGITSLYAGSAGGTPGGSVLISNCYASGSIGASGGGIVGAYSGKATTLAPTIGSVLVINSYSKGTIGTSAGGIYGASYGTSSVAQHCYTSGSGASGGIFSLSTNDNPVGSTYNYSERNNGASGWNDANASASSSTTPGLFPTTVWISPTPETPNTPYIFALFGSSPYIAQIINTDGTFNTSFNPSVSIGGATSSAFTTSFDDYALLSGSASGITINSSTGSINTSAATQPGAQTLLSYGRNITTNKYAVTPVILTVLALPTVLSTISTTVNLKFPTYDIKYEVDSGTSFIVDKAVNSNFKFASYSDVMAYKMALAVRGQR
jgi:hypothetical protein